MNWTFEFRHKYGEEIDIYLNGEHLINLNDDDDGWQGITRIKNLVETIAAVFGAEVIETRTDD